jgi:hypothetical protein
MSSLSATFINFRVNNAEQFKESVTEAANTNLYLTYGKVYSWSSEPTPNNAYASACTVYEIWSNMIGGKKILGNDICHVIPRFNWTANTKYIAYDHRNSNLHDGNTQFYIMTSDYNVYKCLANNNGANSTVEPSAINTSAPTETSDGYVWKYMYTITDSDLIRFTTSEYIPVKTLTGYDGTLQWSVQENSTEGAIYYIAVSNSGSRYTNTSNIIVTINGDGSSATATANINVTSQTVSSITMTDYGQSYTYATVTITGGGGSGAQGIAMISPPGGHGSNPIYELGGSALMLNPTVRGTESGKLPATNDIRQISLLKDPIKRSANTVFANLTFLQATTLTTVGSDNYQEDEYVYQGTLASPSFSGRVVSWDSSNGIVTVINTYGSPTSQALVGSTSTTSRFVSQIVANDLTPYTGQMLYVNNLTAITRSTDQTEDYKIVLKY